MNSFSFAGGNKQVALQIFNNEQSSSKVKHNRPSISTISSKKAQAAFLDSLYGFLDGLVHIAFTSPRTQFEPFKNSDYPTELGLSSDVPITQPGLAVASEEDEIDIRLLLTMSNLANLTAIYIPKIIRQFSEAFLLDMKADVETLMDVVGQLNTLLLGDYIKRKTEVLSDIIQTGVLGGKVNWLTTPKPTGINSFVYDALLSLVLVHSQVTSLVGPTSSGLNGGEPLEKIVLSKLVEELARECLTAFGSVEKFGMGGMLQATLEIEFIHRTLSSYITPEADSSMQRIYQKISSAYQRDPSPEDREGSNNELQRELEKLKRTLHASRRATALEFVCFKKPKTASSESPHDDTSETTTSRS